MSEDSKQVGLDEVVGGDKSGKEEQAVSPARIRQIGIKIPEEWHNISLGELGKLDTSSVNKKSSSDEKSVQLVNYMDIYDNYVVDSDIEYMGVTAPESQIERSQIRPGDILFTPSSEEPRDIGNSAVVTDYMENTLHSYHTVRLRPTSDNIPLDIAFSGWVANAPYVSKQFARRATGSTRYTLTLGDFTDTQVLVPPIEEQRKIATVLYTVDKAIQKTEGIIEQKKRVRSGIMQDLFTGIDADSTKEIRLSAVDTEIPKHWDVATVGEASNQITDGAHLTPDRSDEGYLLLSARNVMDGYLDLTEVDYVPEEEYKRLIEKCNPETGDILISCSGTVGRVCEVPEDLEFALVRSAALVKFKDAIFSGFGEKVLQSSGVQKQIKGYQTQSAQPNLFQGQIASIEIPVPPLEEQREIATRIDDISDSIDSDQRYKAQLKRLKQGLMQDLLSGAVRTHEVDIDIPEEVLAHG